MKKTTMQQLLPLKRANRNKRLSPIEQLFADKIDIKEKCRIQEKKISADLVYIRDHAGGLLLSGMSSLIFLPKNANGKPSNKLLTRSDKNPNKSNNWPAIIKGVLPLLWDILQPIAITWGLSKTKSLITRLFSGKK
ncbi:MAG: hypothetical protein LBF05_03985 [Tannerella sp.]|jgi:hypothetical protein|nr:hypothetical protein [Tannerella sp.]